MQVQSQGIETFFKEKKRHKERCRQNLGAILYGAALAGTWLGRIRTLESVDETPFLSGFEDVIRDLLLLPDKSYHADPMGSFQKMQSHILQFIVCIAEEYSHAASKRLSEIFSKQVESGGIGFSTGNIWRFLEKNHQFDVLKAWLSSEIGPDAWMWSKDVRTSTRMENLEIFMELAIDSHVHECIEIAQVAKERGRWCWVGHVGHKDYSLLPIVDWLDLLEENNHDSLPQFKTDFDILSERVDKLGDNRVHRSQNTPERESNLLTIENPEQFLQENEAFLVEIERNVSEKKELSLDEQKKLLEIVNNFKLIDRLPQFSQSFIEIIKKDGWDYFWYFSGMTNVIEKLRGTNCESSLWELANMCMDYRDFSNTEAWLFALAQDLNSICLAASNSNEELEKGFLRLKQTYELWYTGCGKLI
jgi:hypothetical protein